jgi:signal transduction protein with GAF and PtsI domain
MKNNEKTYFRLLKNSCKAINSSLNLTEVLNLITENVIAALNVKACTVFLWDRERNILEVIATSGLSESYLKKGPVDADRSITDTLEGRSAMIWDTGNDPRLEYPDEAKKEGIASILSVPISVKSQIIGVLRIYTSEKRNFSTEPYEFITCLADMAAIAIDNSRIYDHLKANHDNLVDEEHGLFE